MFEISSLVLFSKTDCMCSLWPISLIDSTYQMVKSIGSANICWVSSVGRAWDSKYIGPKYDPAWGPFFSNHHFSLSYSKSLFIYSFFYFFLFFLFIYYYYYFFFFCHSCYQVLAYHISNWRRFYFLPIDIYNNYKGPVLYRTREHGRQETLLFSLGA